MKTSNLIVTGLSLVLAMPAIAFAGDADLVVKAVSDGYLATKDNKKHPKKATVLQVVNTNKFNDHEALLLAVDYVFYGETIQLTGRVKATAFLLAEDGSQTKLGSVKTQFLDLNILAGLKSIGLKKQIQKDDVILWKLQFKGFTRLLALEGFQVDVVLVPIADGDTIDWHFKADICDLAVGGIGGTVDLTRRVRISDPHPFVNMALVVPDYRDTDFASLKAMWRLDTLRIGALSGGWFHDSLGRYLPDAEIEILPTVREFFESASGDSPVDALLYSAEAGSA